MFTRMLRPLSLCGVLTLCASGGIASAHWTPAVDPCNACAAPQPVCAPVCAQPVACYQTVPVTEYREVRQTVRRPICETKYVDQPCVEYRPVVEQCTVNVPTCEYEDVIECRTVCRDMGGWITRYTPICKLSPCDYDNRPGIGGWLNRTAYSVRASFTPDVIAHREYVPNVVTQTVPVRHRVAKHGVRQVSYNVTRMVAHTTTRKVAVNSVRYVDEQVVAMQPVTVMRTVPIGTALAFGVPAAAASPTRSALAPQPDPVSADRVPRRADASDDRFRDRAAPAPAPARRPDAPTPDPFDRTSIERESTRLPHDHDHGEELTPRRAALGARSHHAARPLTPAEPVAQGDAPRSVPSIVRVGQWTARRSTPDAEPALASPGISVAGQ
ncbi:MAG: hypothetical protein WD069_01240 [Planctomycetales bacterium]